MAALIADKYAAWERECEERFNKLKANEEELNRIFAEIYDMVGEVPSEKSKTSTYRCARPTCSER